MSADIDGLMKPEQPSRLLALLTTCLLLKVAGCGDGNRATLAPVAGTVTYAGQPLEQGQIVFSPLAGRPAYGRIEQGKIVAVTTYHPGDGAPVGSYPIAIASHAPTDGMYAKPEPSLIPAHYANPRTSGLVVDIKAGQLNSLDLRLQSP